MAATYRTPDVYVEETSVVPPSVEEVETAIPAFIGYTEKAQRSVADDLILRPTKIHSLKEFEQHFGFARAEDIEVTVTGDTTSGFTATGFTVGGVDPDDTFLLDYLLYYSVKLYFENGGGQCYIVAVGTYQGTPSITLTGGADSVPIGERHGLRDGLDALALEDEPTLIVIPEAVNLDANDYASLMQAVLAQCAALGDRFAVIDVYHGSQDLSLPPLTGGATDPALSVSREQLGNNNLKYGAAYYPFLRTSLRYRLEEANDASNVTVVFPGGPSPAPTLDRIRTSNTAIYNFVKEELKKHFVIVPPGGAVVGVYASTDTNRGVWKAPANVSLSGVIEPVVKLNNERHAALNVDANSGKSINAIRSFTGKGTLVWGARTLAGNDNEWRYVPVRRFFNMVGESVRKGTHWAVYEPNDANTWARVRGIIENYLTQKWREGALAGATPDDAFFVKCGLGTTMNAQDILEGRMNVAIGMAVVRPAEFIILKFSHKLQTS